MPARAPSFLGPNTPHPAPLPLKPILSQIERPAHPGVNRRLDRPLLPAYVVWRLLFALDVPPTLVWCMMMLRRAGTLSVTDREGEMKFATFFFACGLITLSSADAQEKTYGGRTLEEWTVLAVNDLEPETRTKAMTAIGVLGHHGNPVQAMQALQQVIEQETQPDAVAAAYGALLTFGDEAADVIAEGLRGDNDLRRFGVIEALSMARSAPSGLPFPRLRSELRDVPMQELARQCVPVLMARLEANQVEDEQLHVAERGDETVDVSRRRGEIKRDQRRLANALRFLFTVQDPGEHVATALPVLMQLVGSSDAELSSVAINTIGLLGKDAAPALPLLVEKLGDNPQRPSFPTGFGNPTRSSSSSRVWSPAPFSYNASPGIAASQALKNLGPNAREAIPKLEELAAEHPNDRRLQSRIKSLIEDIRAASENER